MITTPLPEVIHFNPDGTGAGLYTERSISVRSVLSRSSAPPRSSSTTTTQQWEVFDFTGSRVFTDPSREACLRWERQHFNQSQSSDP
jgi:hypothetical protein